MKKSNNPAGIAGNNSLKREILLNTKRQYMNVSKLKFSTKGGEGYPQRVTYKKITWA